MERKYKTVISKFQISGIIIAISIAVFFNLPNLLGYIIKHDNIFFSGQNSWFDPWDVNVYVSAIRWAQEHGFSFENAYTTTGGKTVVLYPLYTLLGTAFAQINSYMLFHTFTFVCGLILTFTIYYLSLKYLNDRLHAIAATFLVSMGGGFGWLLYSVTISPDVHLTPFTFLSTYQRAHESLAVTAMLLSYYFIYKYFGLSKRGYILTSAVFVIITCLFYPYYILSFIIVFIVSSFAFNKINYRDMLNFIILTGIPVFLFSLYLKSTSDFSNVFSPNFERINLFRLFLGYGLGSAAFPLLFRRNKNSLSVFLTIWIIVHMVFSQFPIGISKYFLRGLFFPIIIFLFSNMEYLQKSYKLFNKHIFQVAAIFIVFTTLFINCSRILSVITGHLNSWTYFDNETHEMLIFLQANLVNKNIIAPYPLSNFIPAWSVNKVYTGHHYQTSNFDKHYDLQTRLFDKSLGPDEAMDLFKVNKIDFVVATTDINGVYPSLDVVYKNRKYTLFKVSTN